MTFALTGRVVRHVGDYAVLQLEGGLVPIRDRDRVLVDGDGAIVTVTPLSESAMCGALDACAVFRVQQDGPVGLLGSLREDGSPVPYLFTREWPAEVLLRAQTPAPELDEGAQAEPFGSARRRTPRIPVPQ